MEKFTFGLGVAGLGMIVVFAGLVLLIGFITILGVAAKERKKPAPKTEQKAESVVALPVQTAVAADGVSPEVIAAITAAIAAVWESPNGFVVRHVKRVSNAPAWKRAGRDEQTYSRY